MNALVTGQDVPAGAQLLLLSDEIPEAELLVASLQQQEEALIGFMRKPTEV